MTITSAGNVGIGETNPSYQLEVSAAGGVLASLSATNSNQSYLSFTNSTTGSGLFTDGIIVGLDSDESAVFYNFEATPMRFGTSGTERMRIDDSGNVGIGTTNPQKELEVHGDGTTQVRIVGGDTGGAILNFGTASIPADARIVYSNVSKLMQFRTNNGAYALNIDGSGNVGIGTDNPTVALEIHDDSAKIHLRDTSTAATGVGGVLRLDRKSVV